MKLVPPRFYIDALSNAELKVADLLDQITGDPEAIGYHSVHLPQHQYKMMAEADFVILWKGAILVLEIKGGNVHREDGVWAFRDRFGTSHLKSEGPWQQAQTAMFALRKRLESTQALPRVPYGAIVITPDQNMPTDFEWAPWEYAGHVDMTVARLEAKLDAASKRAREKLQSGPAQSLRPFKEILRANFDRVTRLKEESEFIDDRMVSLLTEQSQLLQSLEDNKRVIVKGGAGTGKTLLAAAAAVRAAAAGQSVLFTCRSRALIEAVSESLAGSTVVCEEFEDLVNLGEFDVVVVDEAHDLMNLDDLAVLEKALKGGFDRGSWWMFVDTNNQAHVDGIFDAVFFSELQSKSAQFTLRTNCRNTEPIVTQVQSLLGADLGIPKVGAGPKVVVMHSGPGNQASRIDAELSRLADQGVATRDIAIVTILEDAAESGAFLSSPYRESFDGLKPKIFTARAIKGLEARHVLVVDVQDLETSEARSRLYVAMTRARVSLWMSIGDPAWNQMARMAAESFGRTR